MPPRSSANQGEGFRSLRSFTAETASGARTPPRGCHSGASAVLDTLRQEAFDSVWSQIENAGDGSNALTDINVRVFESVKEFCRSAHEERSERIPVGALFTGSLVQCHEVQPLQLLGEVLRTASFNVVSLDGLDVPSIGALLGHCLSTLTRKKCREADIDALSVWFSQNASVPFVILIESVEGLDARIFADLLSLLIRCRRTLPVTLLTGLSTDTRIDPLVPSYMRSRLRSRPFALMSPRQCFERILEKMLLSAKCPGIVAGRNVMEVLNNLYLYHHFTIQCFKSNLKQALTDHIANVPLGVLMQYMDAASVHKGSIRGSLEAIPDPFWGAMSPMQKDTIPALMQNALEQVSGWKATILWLYTIAELVGSITRGAGNSLRELYISALNADFTKMHTLPKVVPWATGDGTIVQKNERLSQALERLRNTTDAFSSCNVQLKGMTKRLEGFLKALKSTSEQLPTETTSKKKKSKIKRSEKKSKESSAAHDTHTTVFHSTCRELDEITTSMFEMYCAIPPEEIRGHQIFCLSSDVLMKQRLFAAPRLEIPNLLHDEEAHQRLKDEGNLLKDSAALYNLCLESAGYELNVFDGFVSFAGHYDVTVPEGTDHRESHESEATPISFNRDSDDGEENHRPDVKDLRIRFEWAIRSLEELGLITTSSRAHYHSIRLQIFNN